MSSSSFSPSNNNNNDSNNSLQKLQFKAKLNESSSIISPIKISNETSTTTNSKSQTNNSIIEESPSSKFTKKRENTDMAQNLFLNGERMQIKQVSEQDLEIKRDEFSFLEEEIIEQEGVYEELFAYDNQEEEYLMDNSSSNYLNLGLTNSATNSTSNNAVASTANTSRRMNLNLKRRRHGLPPITPKAAMKDLVTNSLFDHMWSELIDWSTNLIKTYAKNVHDKQFFSSSLDKNSDSLPHSNSQQQQNHSVLTSINTNSITKQTIIPLKPFDLANFRDPVFNGNNNTNYSTNVNFPGVVSRDNSSLYGPPAKLYNDVSLFFSYCSFKIKIG